MTIRSEWRPVNARLRDCVALVLRLDKDTVRALAVPVVPSVLVPLDPLVPLASPDPDDADAEEAAALVT